MADKLRDDRSQSSFADRVFGGNPFPQNDARHEMWESTAVYAAEEYARLEAKWLSRLPPERARPEEFLSWFVDSTAERYDVTCKRLLISIRSLRSVPPYEELLKLMVKSALTNAADKGPSFIPKASLLSELRIRLRQRTAHWTAEALRLARASQAAGGETPSDEEPVITESVLPAPSAPVNYSSAVTQRLMNSPDAQSKTGAGLSGTSSYVLEKGKRCERLVREIRLIKHAYLDQTRKLTQIQEEHPNLLAWEIRDSLDPEDREVFNHPKQWGPVVGYAERLLEKTEQRSRATVQRWRKRYKRTLKDQKK